ncbi:RNA pseudouridine synthase, partial [candidate division GN15 bacterium]|nr:RNA pseudouridine synthase [candidate division GN15 bacterium]
MTADRTDDSGPAPRNEHHQVAVPESAKGERLDRYLGNLQELEISRTKVQKLIDDGLITVDGEAVAGKYKLKGGEVIDVLVPPETPTHIVGEAIELDIVYEDAHLVVINKPAGMVTHPAAGHRSGTLVNALVHRFGELAEQGSHRPGIVHRLDKDTSGLLVVARDDRTFAALQQAIKDREVQRTYLAVVCGHLQETGGTLEMPIGRSSTNRKKMAVTDLNSKPAVTH